MNAASTTRSKRPILELFVVVMVAGLSFALGRQSDRFFVDQPATESDAVRALIEQLAEGSDAASEDVVLNTAELEQIIVGYLHYNSRQVNRQVTVSVGPVSEFPSFRESEWGSWPELPEARGVHPWMQNEPLEGPVRVLESR